MANSKVILFADNDLDFLEVRALFLKQAGYQVVTATNPQETREKLEQGGIDLAIIDIRLDDNEKTYDESGLNIALESDRRIPKIILTAYPSFEYTRRAKRKGGSDSIRAAVNFLGKEEKGEVLLRAIEEGLRSQNVFIVHGHDERARDSVALVVQQLGLKPIILVSQSNKGRTIIEKLEDHASEAVYAVVIMTPDDVGYAKREGKAFSKNRARQNVVFELGYFVGKLGRDKICLLHQGDAEIFSDYQGVAFVKMDDNDWKQSLAGELRAADLPVDLNDLMNQF
jgi:predicted nucleotide-binding protein